eukprot:Selendium_serpulae@DN6359_c0_g2_i10.p4
MHRPQLVMHRLQHAIIVMNQLFIRAHVTRLQQSVTSPPLVTAPRDTRRQRLASFNKAEVTTISTMGLAVLSALISRRLMSCRDSKRPYRHPPHRTLYLQPMPRRSNIFNLSMGIQGFNVPFERGLEKDGS